MIGRTLSHFRILSRIGEGGMGVVYKAEDEKLHRSVALKVLPPEAVGDEERRLRFLHEARAAASLTHPSIATIHEVDEADGVIFIAMEYIEGKTLRSLLAGKSLPVREAVRVGIDIADGLACAHRSRIIHRDLKPENVMVTGDGYVKILDFGLAKLLEGGDELRTEERSQLDTISGEMTERGRILGTAAYMSPEQARGQSVDTRSDLFAFGIVLYEMLTGKTPFHGPTPIDTLTAILHKPAVPLAQFNGEAPAELDRIVGKCLEKDPSERYQDTRDLVVDLRRLKRDTESRPLERLPSGAWQAKSATGWAKWWRIILGMGAVVTTAGLAWLAWQLWPRPSPAPGELKQRLVLTDRGGGVETYASLAPDGKYLAVADTGGLTVRVLESGESRRLALPEGEIPVASSWSADAAKLFVSAKDGEGRYSIWTVQLVTGLARRLRGGDSFGGLTSPDGSLLLFSSFDDEGQELWVMRHHGDSPRRLARAGKGESFRSVAWSPQGRRVAFFKVRLTGDRFDASLESQSLQGGPATVILSDRRLLVPSGGGGGITWLSDGRLIFALVEPPPNVHDMNLWALQVDESTGAASGAPKRLTNWAGSQVEPLDATADGKRLLISKNHSQGDVYVGELEGEGSRIKPPRRVTLDDWNDWMSGWMRDSRRVLFFSDRNGTPDIFVQDVEGGEAVPLVSGPDFEMTPVPAPDGSSIFYRLVPAAEGLVAKESTLMRLELAGGAPQPLLKLSAFSDVRCPTVASASCVLSEVKEKEVIFHAFDPAQGRGDLIARSNLPAAVLPAWDLTADGSRIALVAYPANSDRIRILELPGAVAREIILPAWKNLQTPAWSADGKSLFVTNLGGSEEKATILRVGMDGRAQVLVESQFPWEWLGRLFASPDGRYLAYGSRTYTKNFWILEDF